MRDNPFYHIIDSVHKQCDSFECSPSFFGAVVHELVSSVIPTLSFNTFKELDIWQVYRETEIMLKTEYRPILHNGPFDLFIAHLKNGKTVQTKVKIPEYADYIKKLTAGQE